MAAAFCIITNPKKKIQFIICPNNEMFCPKKKKKNTEKCHSEFSIFFAKIELTLHTSMVILFYIFFSTTLFASLFSYAVTCHKFSSLSSGASILIYKMEHKEWFLCYTKLHNWYIRYMFFSACCRSPSFASKGSHRVLSCANHTRAQLIIVVVGVHTLQ